MAASSSAAGVVTLTPSAGPLSRPPAAADASRPQLPSVRRRWLERLIPALLCVLILGQLLLKNQRLSQTADESTHLYAGYRALKCNDFGFSYEHPPLAKVVAALPLLAQHLPVNCDLTYRDRGDEAPVAVHWLYSQDWRNALFAARTAISIIALGTCILVWTVARRMFGFATAIVAAVFFAFDPNMIAHGGLVTTDMAIALTMPLAVYAFYRWVQKPTALRLLLAGVATGLVLIAKHSGILILPMLFLLAIADASLMWHGWRSWWRVVARNLLALGLIVVLAAGVVWCAYGLHFAAHRDGSPLWPQMQHYEWNSQSGILLAMMKGHVLPEAYLAGVGVAMGMAQLSCSWGTFILGKMWPGGQWFFFPVVMAIKYTVPFLFLMMVAIFAVPAVFRQHRREVVFLSLPAVLFLLACMYANMSSGVRHILPLQVFLLILAAAGCVELGRRVRWVRYAVPGLILLHAASSLHAFPNYLSYANELWGGPSKLYRYLPNSDWGEAYLEARKYMQVHPGPCWLVTEIQNDPREYGVPCTPLGVWFHDPVPSRMQGTVIVSTFALRMNFSLPGGRYFPFTKVAPVARLGGSALLVFHGDFDTHAAAAFTDAAAAKYLLSQGRFEAALAQARTATELWPDFAGHFQYCRALVANGEVALARVECEHARNLLFEQVDPSMLVYQPAQARNIDAGINEAIAARVAMEDGQWAAALRHARAGVTLAPWSPTVRLEYCRALSVSHDFRRAAGACDPERLYALELPAFPRSAMLSWDPTVNELDELNLLLHALGERR